MVKGLRSGLGATMPAKDVMPLFRQGKLHSGPGGPIVESPVQARAIQISYARKEGHNIPKPGRVGYSAADAGGYGKAFK